MYGAAFAVRLAPQDKYLTRGSEPARESFKLLV